MKYKEQIIGVTILVVVFGALGSVWQFYYKDIFEGYKADDTLRETLEKTHSQLAETFQGYKPELLIQEWQNKMQPWRNAREERATYFSYGDWYDTDVKWDEEGMLKFWYTEESNKMLMDIYRRVYEKMGGYDRFPQNIREILNVQQESDWADRDVTIDEVMVNLKVLSFGQSLTQLLLDSNVSQVHNVSVWPRRIPKFFAELLGLQTVGLRISITARDLVKMLDNLRMESRYFTVEGLKISYPYIGYPSEPQLNVSLLLTQAVYRKPADATIQPTAASASRSSSSSAARSSVTTEEPGFFGKAWTWFKRTVLVMN